MRLKPVLLLAAIAALAACTTPVDTSFGEAVKWDYSQQVIDPDPVYEGELVEGGSGQHSAAAVDRYNKGTVKQPVSISTGASGGGPK